MTFEEDKINAALSAYVQSALSSKSLGQDATVYRQLTSHISQLRGVACGQHSQQAAAEQHQLALLLQACTRHVSYIQQGQHSTLVGELMAIMFWNCGQEVLKSLLDFVVKLLVANGSMTALCLRRLVFSLIPPRPALETPLPGTPWQATPQQAAVQDEIIKTLADILLLVPTAPKTVLYELSHRMPFRFDNRAAPCMFFRAVYQLSQTAAGDCIRDGLQAVMVDCLLNIDVEIKWQDIADQQADHIEDERESDDEQDVFALEGRTGPELQDQAVKTLDEAAADPAVSRGGWEGAAATQDVTPVASTSDRSPIDETADALDSLMEQTFEHLVWRCQHGQLHRAWTVMMSTFERTLLLTYRSKFTQFLVYYMCQQSLTGCTPAFVSFLLKRIHDPNRPVITRTACAAYLASFLARAKFLPKSLLVTSLLDMAKWCAQYCKTHDMRQSAAAILPPSNAFAMGVQHQVFYAMCQGLLYAFCYHLDSLLDTADDSDCLTPSRLQSIHISDTAKPAVAAHSDSSSMQPAGLRQTLSELLPQILHHRLAPLKVCAPSVAQQFLQQAQRLSLLDTSSLHTAPASVHMQVRPLEMFFPFDPYLLRRSARFLDLSTSYNTWSGTRHQDTDASHLSSDDELEVLEGTEAQDDSSSNDEEFEPHVPQGIAMQPAEPLDPHFASQPLGIARRFQSKVADMQPGSYDSRGMIEGSSLGSSPKVIAGSFEPIPMSC